MDVVFLISYIQAGNLLGESLQLLLRAVLSKMHSVQTSSVMQSLLIVFADLIQKEVHSCVHVVARHAHYDVMLSLSLSLCSVGVSCVIFISSS